MAQLYFTAFLLAVSCFIGFQDSAAQTLFTSDTVRFASDSDALDSAAQATLARLLQQMDPRLDSVLIDAHTDSDGDDKYNERLSRSRAAAVRNWLVGQGVEEGHIGLGWQGETRPIAPNSTNDGRYMNRRAVIRVYKPVRMVPFVGSVSDSTGQPLLADVFVRGKDFADSTRTDSSGNFVMTVPDSSVLSAEISSPGHVYETRMFNSARQREMSFKLRTLETGIVFQLHRFYFVGNQPVFLDTSLPELGRLLRFMRENDGVEISIEGHVNYPNSPPVAKNTGSYKLSVDRAKAVYDHLVNNGIDSTRLAYAGFGNWNMVYPNAQSEEKMRKNRRVEIRITGY